MTVKTNTLVSITEANQNFSRVARIVDENGSAIILKNNVPRYIIMEFPEAEKLQAAPDDDVEAISRRLIEKILKLTRSLRNDISKNRCSTNEAPVDLYKSGSHR